ncbi:PQQ-binding-like beta-propeller repeat protein [Acidisphaera sp. L21]|uniref:outer membrane protein assembly factor BamB family protein n=1 Tax=Acidisphaera sp. L21 TaxID=1641851 RepID=UPI00131C1C01|nr:PQQ-binding-like beta-propeller repeat protein [Acidisphaera sp. L21]
MSRSPDFSRRVLLRTVSLAPIAVLAGCNTLDDLFESDKPPLPGKREAVIITTRGMQVDPSDHRPVNLPAPVLNAEWPQSGGGPAHVMGNVALGDLSQHWRRSIGEGGGYRQKITAAPVIAGGRVYTMDSDASVSAFDLASGSRQWRVDTQGEKDRSTNVGGGLAFAAGVVFVTTGRSDVLALDPATGKTNWRVSIGAPARSAPTVVDGRLFVSTIDERLVALSTSDGKQLWNYQATSSSTIVLGEPAPAYADGLVVAGFGSGDLVALRADTGTLAWSDSLAAARGRNSMADLSAIRALPVIVDNVVYAIGVGGLFLALDLRSGRRLWEREAAGQNTPCIAGDWIFVLTLDQQIACLSKADGRIRWMTQLARYEDPAKSRDPIFWTGPLLGGQYLYLAGSTEKLTAVNPQTGEVLGQQDLPDAVSVGLVAAGGKLFVVTDDASLTAFG